MSQVYPSELVYALSAMQRSGKSSKPLLSETLLARKLQMPDTMHSSTVSTPAPLPSDRNADLDPSLTIIQTDAEELLFELRADAKALSTAEQSIGTLPLEHPGAENAADPAENAADPAENAADLVENAVDHVENAADHVENAADPVENAADPVENAADHVENAADLVENAADHVENAADSAENAADPFENAVDHVENAADPVENAADPAVLDVLSVDALEGFMTMAVESVGSFSAPLNKKMETYTYHSDPVHGTTKRSLFWRKSDPLPQLYWYNLYGAMCVVNGITLITPCYVELDDGTTDSVLSEIGQTMCYMPRYDGLLTNMVTGESKWVQHVNNKVARLLLEKTFDRDLQQR